jgi:phosphoribosylanthranilate isomerase
MAERLRIKICGITNAPDAELAARLGADAVGLNFYPRSPRCVDAAAVPAILRALPPFVEPVGLFVNEPLRQVRERAQHFGLRLVQWHGDNHEVGSVDPCRLIPAFHVRGQEQLRQMADYLEACRANDCLPAAVLVDAQAPGQYGGTGQAAPWHLLADFRPGVPLILAGGLTPDNVAEAVRIVRPYAVDVASGVEGRPGQKDADKLHRFIENARAASP